MARAGSGGCRNPCAHHPEQPPNAAGPRLPPLPRVLCCILGSFWVKWIQTDPCCLSCGSRSSQISPSAAPDRPPHGSAQQQTAGFGTNTRWFPAHFNLEGKKTRGIKSKFTPKRRFGPYAVTPGHEEPPSSLPAAGSIPGAAKKGPRAVTPGQRLQFP